MSTLTEDIQLASSFSELTFDDIVFENQKEGK